MDDLKSRALKEPLMSAVIRRLENDGSEKKEACDGCGQCCSRFLPMTDSEKKIVLDNVALIFKDKFERSNIRKQLVFYDPDSMKCPLYADINDHKGSCIIYGNRPGSCLVFDCSIVMNDKPLEEVYEKFITGSGFLHSDTTRIVDMAVLIKTAEIMALIDEEEKRHGTKLQDRIKENLGLPMFARLFPCDIERYAESEIYSTNKGFIMSY